MKAARLCAPQQDGAVLIEPSPADWLRCLRTNAQQLQKSRGVFCGVALADWRREMQGLVRCLAAQQLARWGLQADWPDTGFLVAGHQPELFHPGVWAKHFAVGEAAASMGLAPLNLIADQDQPKRLAIRVPTRTSKGLGVCWVPFYDASPILAWEEYELATQENKATPTAVPEGACIFEPQAAKDLASAGPVGVPGLSDFGHRVAAVCGELLPAMILPRFWTLTMQLASRLNPPLGLAELLAGARRTWEQRWNYYNAEVRVSALCDTEPFLAFVATILGQLPGFVQHHNAELHAFRRENRVRSRSHPVPPLQIADGWYEAPFWVWTRGQPRQRLWWCGASHCWQLRLGEVGPSMTIPAMRRREDLLSLRQSLSSSGWKIRPRALTLTLFARLFLAEMFVHGIGGGIYDRFTDRLMSRIWDIEPPQYAVVTATLRLPLPVPSPPGWNRAEVLHRLRDCRFNPDRVLPAELLSLPEVQALVQRKRELLGQWSQANRQQRAILHQELAEVRKALWPLVRNTETGLRQALAELASYQAQRAVALDREWAFVLYADTALTRLVERIRQEFAARCRA